MYEENIAFDILNNQKNLEADLSQLDFVLIQLQIYDIYYNYKLLLVNNIIQI